MPIQINPRYKGTGHLYVYTSMVSDRTNVLAKVSFKLARRHTWARELPIDDFLNDVLSHDEMEVAKNDVLPDVRRGRIEWLGYRSNGTEWIWLRGDKHDEVAEFLRRDSDYTRLQIEATLSRFDGF